MMLDSKGTMSRDMKDACDLFDFVSEKQRAPSEIDGYINSLAHQKYPYSKTQAGHELRVRYKNWLRFQMRNMTRMYLARKKSAPNPLNNSKQ